MEADARRVVRAAMVWAATPMVGKVVMHLMDQVLDGKAATFLTGQVATCLKDRVVTYLKDQVEMYPDGKAVTYPKDQEAMCTQLALVFIHYKDKLLRRPATASSQPIYMSAAAAANDLATPQPKAHAGTVGSAFEMMGKSVPSASKGSSGPETNETLLLKAITTALSGEKKSRPGVEALAASATG